MNSEREALERLRGHLAYSKQCAPYYIFRDEERDRLLIERPTTIEKLASIKGFPKEGSRVTKWGAAIIQIFIDYSKIKDFEVTGKAGEDPLVRVIMKESKAFG